MQQSVGAGDVSEAAAALVGEPVVAIVASGEGANSRIFRFETRGRRLALKVYPRRPGDVRDRLDAEWRALTFLRSCGVDAVPEPVAIDRDRRLMVMEWLDGELATRHAPGEVAQAMAFLRSVFNASERAAPPDFPLASEACLSTAAIVTQIEARLRALPQDNGPAARLIAAEIRPAFARALASIGDEVQEARDLPHARRRLIPADFGFHNAIREPGGRLRFFDFDYFGWDDPVKLAADILLHPAMDLTPDEGTTIQRGMAEALPDDPDFTPRLRRQLPLYAVRWALILLNPFRMDRAAALPTGEAAQAALLADRAGKVGRALADAARLSAA